MVELDLSMESLAAGWRASTGPTDAVVDQIYGDILERVGPTARQAQEASPGRAPEPAVTPDPGSKIAGLKVLVGMGCLAAVVAGWVALREEAPTPVDTRAATALPGPPTDEPPASSPSPESPASSHVPVPSEDPGSAAPAEASAEADAVESPTPATSTRRRPQEPSDPAVSEPAPKAPDGTADRLRAEADLVAAADAAVRSSRFAHARVLISRHSREFPEGLLGIEVDALARLVACLDHDPNATEDARAFLREAKPPGGLATRLRSACTSNDSPPKESPK